MPKIEPAKLVTFTTVNGQLGAEFQKPLVLTSPPMVTCFPKLNQQALARDQDRGINTLDFSLDLTMTGAREPQLDFKAAIDGFDDLLLEYVFANQAIMGKKGMTKDQVEVMQKRAFRSRVNFKTSRVYPDAMSCRTKGLRDLTSMPVVDVNNMQYVPDVVGNDIVSVVLVYNGPYAKPNNFFGNSWSLVGVQRLGHMEPKMVEPADVGSAFQPWSPDAFPV
jgi:hypothetical protein